MKKYWEQAKQRLAEFNQREKILILVTGAVLFPGLVDVFLLQPLRDESAILRTQTDSVNQRLSSFQTQQNELLEEIKSDPAMGLARKIDGVKKELAITKNKMIDYTNTLIAPQKMASMLENMLHERGDLKLISLENLPVAPLFDRASSETTDKEGVTSEKTADVFGLYRHGIKLQFKGNYMSSMKYLEKMEGLPWKFYWENFTYEVEEHPMAISTINIYTLSTSSWWIGDSNEE